MGRNRVLSFMSQFSSNSKPPTPSSSPPGDSPLAAPRKNESFVNHQRSASTPVTPPSHQDYGSLSGSPANSPHRHKRSTSRPLSMVQTYRPLKMDVNEDTIPELQPVFSFLNSHSNKLYQEGYFLKLDDQNSQGKPNADRTWTECFAQLVGTVLSLWDAAELDAAGEDGEVLPKFLNLTDASIKMIESLPTRSNEEQPLQNILSISTAGRNRYLLHFNSHEALVEWTSGIRLSIYEHNTLQEAYTGALIAGKGRTVNNINVIMERSRFPTEEWVRVRFGAGVPWRRCWCVITPPDEKEFAKQQKEMKKRSPYDRSAVPTLKGDIKFYDVRKEGKKQKKVQPIATITDAYSAYAIYPQAKSLVDASTLLKIEGNVTVHSEPPSSSEGFVFIMPEVHPMVSGFEMLLRFLFPTWDTFALYGRPGKLVASTLDPRSLMFAMPKHKRYGYMELQDVTALTSESGSATWTEQEWRRRLKEATGTRMNSRDDSIDSRSRSNSHGSGQNAFGHDAAGAGRSRVGFATDGKGSGRSSRSHSLSSPSRTDSAPPDSQRNRNHPPMPGAPYGHGRNASDPDFGGGNYGPGGNSYGGDNAQRGQAALRGMAHELASEEERGGTPPIRELGAMRNFNTPEPVSRPPQFGHNNQSRPMSKAYHSPELRRANSRLSNGTLAQLAKAGGLAVRDDTNPGNNSPQRRNVGDGAIAGPSVHPHAATSLGTPANDDRSREALRQNHQRPPALNIPSDRSGSPATRSPYGPPSPYTRGPNSPALPEGQRPYPPGPPGAGPPPPSPGFRPDPSRPPPQGRGGRGGPPPNMGGRGRPPPNMGGPPEQYGRGRGGPGGPNLYPGGPGGHGPPGQRNPGHPDRSTSLNKHKSVTPVEIIDHYTSDHGQSHDQFGRPSQSRDRPYDDGAYDQADRPRAGVLKTVGGGDAPPPAQRPDFDIPGVDFGPTFNYGGGRPNGPGQRGPPPPGGPHGQRPYSPAGPRPGVGGRNSPAPHQHQGMRRPEEGGPKRVPWQPGGPPPGSGAHGVSPEQYVQQRAAENTHHRRRSSFDMMSPGHMRRESAESMQRPSTSGGPLAERDAWAMDARQQHHQNPMPQYGQQTLVDRSMSPRPTTPGMGRGGGQYGGAPQYGAYGAGGGPSYSRPMPADAQPPRQVDPRVVPPQGQYSNTGSPQQPRSVHPQYQGQAF